MRTSIVMFILMVALSFQVARGKPDEPTWPVELDNVPAEEAIGFCLYTTHAGVLKLTAQLYPLADGVERTVVLHVREGEDWKEIAKTLVSEEPYGFPQQDIKRWTAHFRITDWDMTRDFDYRVTAAGGAARYEGRIRRDPVDKDEIVVAAFTGNSSRDRRLKPDLIANITAQDPDLLFFSGDQVYDHQLHYQAWLLFGRQFGEIIKDRPTICIPDDHDIGQGNLWGEMGVDEGTSQAGDRGGYYWSAQYVRSVENAQTWHLPDPVDPEPVERGIGVYFTAMNVGRVGFAIIEDRKFKTGPGGFVPPLGPRPDHITDPDFDRQAVDLPDARLLGERQLKFLREWGQDWRGQHFKSVLSQTVFANAAHLHGRYEYRLVADLDSNGWPQSGRNRALEEIRRFYGFMISGDQHLATVIHHGVNQFGDAGYSFCVPSIVNFYNRWWLPEEEPARKIDGPLPALGDYSDGFGNKLTMHAYANPDEARRNKYAGEWGERADGHGIVRFHIPTRKITIECWPRGVDVAAADAEQYPGWPITVDQADNYGRQAMAWLPTVRVEEPTDPVLQVIDETYGDIVYTIRIRGTEHRPKVFRNGRYTLRIGEQPDRMRTLTGILATEDNQETLDVSLP
jgi:phosphodiesterase/alkaline phosphatase D-like protein